MAREIIETRQLRTLRTLGALVVSAGGELRITRAAMEDITNWEIWEEADTDTGDLILKARRRQEDNG